MLGGREPLAKSDPRRGKEESSPWSRPIGTSGANRRSVEPENLRITARALFMIALSNGTEWRITDSRAGFWRVGDEIKMESCASDEAVLQNVTLAGERARVSITAPLTLRAKRLNNGSH